jgi:hypothetical protein
VQVSAHGARRSRPAWWEAAFVAGFALLGWLVGHDLAYDVVGLLGAPVDAHEAEHGYLSIARHLAPLSIVVSYVAVLAVALRGRRPQVAALLAQRRALGIAMSAPTLAFSVAEVLERMGATHHAVPVQLLAAGAIVQAGIGLLVHALLRVAFRVADTVALRMAASAHVRRHAPRSIRGGFETPWQSTFAGRLLTVRGPPVRG